MSSFDIGKRRIGTNAPCFIIAEAGVNHNGDLDLGLQLVDIAADAGADAVKFQTFTADRLATADAPKANYQVETTGSGQSQLAMLQSLELSRSDHLALIERCRERNILFLSTPFDEESADLLESLGIVAFKTPSGELTNLPYLRHIAAFGKPMIVSTGMATMAEVGAAVKAIRDVGACEFALLHCVSMYPAEPQVVNLRAMDTLARAYGVSVGYSDHTAGIEITLAAVARDARVIEKHFTISRDMPGPDHRASLEPSELAALVRGIRAVESSLGDGRKIPAPGELSTATAARKSLILARDVAAGDILGGGDLIAKRAGIGIPPSELERITGRFARVALAKGTVLEWEMLG